MKKICNPLTALLLSGILISCGGGWSSEDEKAFMSNCQSEAVAGIGIGKITEKLTDKKMVRDNIDIDSYCECSYKYAKKHWNSFEEFKSSNKDAYILELVTDCNKYLLETE